MGDLLPDKCERVGYPEILSINATIYNNIIIEFTEEVSFTEPVVASDFDLKVVDSLGEEYTIEYTVPEDAWYYLPGKTLVLYVDDWELIRMSQDMHSLIQIQYKNTGKVFDGFDLELVDNSIAYGYMTQQDINWLFPFSTWWTFFFGRLYMVICCLIVSLVLMATFLTTQTTIVPMWLTLNFAQQIYFTIMWDVRYNRFFHEFLKHIEFSTLEFSLFPHLITDLFFNTDRTSHDVYDWRFKRMGLYHNSTIVNAECKFEVFAIWFLFLAPIAIFLRLFFKFTFIRKGHKCTRFMNWPSKFFYSQTSMLLITCFQPLFVTSVMEIRQVDFSSGYAILSYTIAIVVSLLCLFTFLSVWLVNMKNFKNYRQVSVKKIFESYVTPMRRQSFVAFLITVGFIHPSVWPFPY